jgi:protein arginine kinase activator
MSNHSHPENLSKKKAERPLECTDCKKNITIHYTEIVGDHLNETVMCADCPQLKKKLQGESSKNRSGETLAQISCGHCGTTLESIRMGGPLGCSECYDLFQETIIQELIESEALPPHITKKTKTLHIGRTPGEKMEMTPSMRLLGLTEALNDTLKKEDYEQAAILRDQIRQITQGDELDEKK